MMLMDATAAAAIAGQQDDSTGRLLVFYLKDNMLLEAAW